MPGIGDKLMTASEIKEVTDTKLDKDFSSLDTSGGFSLSDTIPVNISGTTYKITGQTLSNAIGGGGGTQQASLTNYVKNCGTISVLPVTLTDSNITSDMIVIEYLIGDETALGSDWTVTTADGSLTISGTLNKSTTLQLVLSVGYSTTPSILTNLASDSADNVLKASPRPGVTGVLPLLHGGLGSSTASGARTNLSVYSKAETDSAIGNATEDKAHWIYFASADWADVYSKLSRLSSGETATIFIGTNVASFMTGGNVSNRGLVGYISATNLSAGRYTMFATHNGCDFSCMWEINGLTSASATPTIINFKKIDSAEYHVGDTFMFDGMQVPFRNLADKSAIYFAIRLPKVIGNDITSFNIEITSGSNTWYTGSTNANLSIGQISTSSTFDNKAIANNRNAIKFSVTTTQTPVANSGIGICELYGKLTFT